VGWVGVGDCEWVVDIGCVGGGGWWGGGGGGGGGGGLCASLLECVYSQYGRVNPVKSL